MEYKCVQCLNTGHAPKLLSCFHVFCQQCLSQLLTQHQQTTPPCWRVQCPTCNQTSLVPGGEVSALPTVATGACPDHAPQELQGYCRTCEQLVCSQCTATEHAQHSLQEIAQVSARQRAEIEAGAGALSTAFLQVRRALAGLDHREALIGDKEESVQKDIMSMFVGVEEAVQCRREELLTDLHTQARERCEGMAGRRQELTWLRAALSSCVGYLRGGLRQCAPREVLLMRGALVQHMDLLLRESGCVSAPDHEAVEGAWQVSFSASPQHLLDACSTLGGIESSQDPAHLAPPLTDDGNSTMQLGAESAVDIPPLTSSQPSGRQQLRKVSLETGKKATGHMRRASLDTNLLLKRSPSLETGHAPNSRPLKRSSVDNNRTSKRPSLDSSHALKQAPVQAPKRSSMDSGQSTQLPPILTLVTPPPDPTSLRLLSQRLQTPVLTLSGVKGPCGVAIRDNGQVLVAEGCGDRVSVFSSAGDWLLSFGGCGSGPGEFTCPCEVAVDWEGNVLVVDGSNRRIQKFTPEGQFLTSVGSSGLVQFVEPDGIAVNPLNGNVYVVNNNTHRIQILNPDLSFCNAFGKEGTGCGYLRYPWGVACSPQGEVYITDSGNCRVQVFSPSGHFLRGFGQRGRGQGELRWPTGISISPDGSMVYVSDYGNHRVCVFSSEGVWLHNVGRKGKGTGEMGNTRGVKVDRHGLLYVCDTDNNRVLLY